MFNTTKNSFMKENLRVSIQEETAECFKLKNAVNSLNKTKLIVSIKGDIDYNQQNNSLKKKSTLKKVSSTKSQSIKNNI